MPAQFERIESWDGLTFKIYRGEGVSLLAFDLDPAHATDDFVGFSVEVKYPNSDHWGALGLCRENGHLKRERVKRHGIVVSARACIHLDP